MSVFQLFLQICARTTLFHQYIFQSSYVRNNAKHIIDKYLHIYLLFPNKQREAMWNTYKWCQTLHGIVNRSLRNNLNRWFSSLSFIWEVVQNFHPVMLLELVCGLFSFKALKPAKICQMFDIRWTTVTTLTSLVKMLNAHKIK